MIFKSKRDVALIALFSSNIFLILIALIVVLTTLNLDSSEKAFLGGLIIITGGLLVSSVLFISYECRETNLFIRNGLFFKKIPYEQISKAVSVQFTMTDLLSGYRVLSSRDGLILYYRYGASSIKISPTNKALFLAELQQKTPELSIEKDD